MGTTWKNFHYCMFKKFKQALSGGNNDSSSNQFSSQDNVKQNQDKTNDTSTTSPPTTTSPSSTATTTPQQNTNRFSVQSLKSKVSSWTNTNKTESSNENENSTTTTPDDSTTTPTSPNKNYSSQMSNATKATFESLKSKAIQASQAATRVIPRRRASYPTPPVTASSYHGDRVIISAGGDLIVRYQPIWRQIHANTVEQQNQRKATDAKLKKVLNNAQKKSFELDNFINAYEQLMISNQLIEDLNEKTKSLVVDLSSIEKLIDDEILASKNKKIQEKTKKAFEQASLLDIKHYEQTKIQTEKKESSPTPEPSIEVVKNSDKRKSIELETKRVEDELNLAQVELISDEDNSKLDEFLADDYEDEEEAYFGAD